MPKLRDPGTRLSETFTIRTTPAMLADLDELATRLSADPARSAGRPVPRQAAGRIALERGIRALGAELSGEDLAAPVDVEALADALADALAGDALDILAELMRSADAPPMVRVRAAAAILDRAGLTDASSVARVGT